jgi:hypothetical protein
VKADRWIAPPSPIEKVEYDCNTVRNHAEETGHDPSEIERIELQYIHVVDDDDPDVVEVEI